MKQPAEFQANQQQKDKQSPGFFSKVSNVFHSNKNTNETKTDLQSSAQHSMEDYQSSSRYMNTIDSSVGGHGSSEISEQDFQAIQNEMINNIFKTKDLDLKGKGGSKIFANDKIDSDSLKTEAEMFEKDGNGRTIIHRLAVEQRANALLQVLKNLENSTSNFLHTKLEERDKYGNTPLGLACIYQIHRNVDQTQQKQRKKQLNIAKLEDNKVDSNGQLNDDDEDEEDDDVSSSRLEVVKILLAVNANPNVYNPSTFWTPLHWAARYGDFKVIRELYLKDADEFVPDKNGLYPIDYAGMFGHYRVVKFLLQMTLKKISTRTLSYVESGRLDQYVSPLGRAGPLLAASSALHSTTSNLLMLYSPVFHTSMLYWAASFNKIESSILEELLKRLEAYPEGSVPVYSARTPCHAAALVGNHEKLKILLSDINNRYIKNRRAEEEKQTLFRKKNPCPSFYARWATVLKEKKYMKINKFYTLIFEKKLAQYRSIAKFKFDFQDLLQNTPLHLASQNGRHICTKILITEYDLSLDIRNSEGWMPKDLTQYKTVRAVYDRFYRQLEKNLNQANNLSRQGSTVIQMDTQFLDGPPEGTKAVTVSGNVSKITMTDEKKVMNKELLKCVEWMPKIPLVVMKVNVAQSHIINKLINSLMDSGFEVQMIQAVSNPNCYYLALQMAQDLLEKEAKHIGLEIKLVDVQAKQAFEPKIKIRYEPFRSKDIQTIMVTIVNRMINAEQLKKQNILYSILQIHDLYGIHDIKSKWESHSKFIPMPLSIINQFYKEGIRKQFSEISAIKNYFGEKIGFDYAFKSFYICGLLTPAVCGLAISIYQFISGLDTIYTSLFAILVSIWITIFIERWKRKSSEICMKWGLFKLKGEGQRQLRPEFCGDEAFSKLNNDVEKKNKSIKGMLIFIASMPLLVIMLGLSLFVFFETKAYQEEQRKQNKGSQMQQQIIQTVAGVINGIAISTINFIFQKLLIWFIKNENHKYKDSYEYSFIYKLFIFKFINTNISLFYTAFYPIDKTGLTLEQINDKQKLQFNNLFTLLLGMVIQKCATIILTRGPLKWLLFWWSKRSYFKRIDALAKEQQITYSMYKKDMNTQDQEQQNQEIMEKMSKSIYKGITPQNPAFQRIVFHTQNGVENHQLCVDAIEVNNLMSCQSEITGLNETSDFYIMFGLATMFAAVCPIISIIIFLHTLVEIRIDLYSLFYFHQRPLQEQRAGIGPWFHIAEFISVITVVTNALLVYLSQTNFQQVFLAQFNLNSAQTMWVILLIEHGILALKFFLAAVIKDRPTWVEKSLKKIEHEVDQIQIQQAEQNEKETINELNGMLSKISGYYNKLKEGSKLMKKDLIAKELTIQQLKHKGGPGSEGKKSEENKTKKVLEDINKEKQMKDGEVTLADFLHISSQEFLGKQRKEQLEEFLNKNFQKRLYSQVFNQIEKEILTRRIGKIHQAKNQTLINCIECTKDMAIIECVDCKDHFCNKCSDQIHKSSQIYSMHTLIRLSIQDPTNPNNLSILEQRLKENSSVQKQASVTAQISNWKKFEYFNFPIDPSNDQHQYLAKHFQYLRSQYIENNFITGVNKIDYTSLFVGTNYDILTKTQGDMLQQRHKKIYGDDKHKGLVPQFFYFNDEELFYLNRLAYYLFKFKGDNLTFAQFAARLDILQNQPFTKQIVLWLQIMDDKDEDFISKEQFRSILKLIFVQDINKKLKDEDIVNMIFEKESEESLKINIGNLIKQIQQNENAKAAMKCILQNELAA